MARITDEDLRWLLELLQQEALAEIEVHEGEEEVLLRGTLGLPPAGVAFPPLAPAPPPPAGAGALELTENQIPVLSPMAGVFYVAPSPGAAPFVKVGDHVEHGDTVGLVEAMKLFSEVPAPTSGTVIRFLVQNEETVEADQCLMVIERSRH
ncbi:MAG: biotin carboxyl carrier domain-containing protein [candidate division WS1 bacterium]|nr:biotin carboxyl carrier domain-containing protein [candidate division WS1 bacterium]